ncbi:MAG TPA: hypothetical protein ENK18_22105 [Deltaproteobacteria bacterium]|nr:hypothetical protein [Deltaproteobacteria bacterium]
MAHWIVALSVAWALTDTGSGKTTPTGDTGAEPTETTGGGYEPVDTAPPCPDCKTAAELAGDLGGSPCGTGCSSGSTAPALLLLPTLLLLRRTRRG